MSAAGMRFLALGGTAWLGEHVTSKALALGNQVTCEQEAARDRIEELRDKLDQQREQDCAAYGEAFKANVLAAAAELLPELRVPVEVRVELHWQNNAGSAEAAGPAWRLWERARAETPLPGSGIPLKNYPLHVSVGDVERAAGRHPLARVDGPS